MDPLNPLILSLPTYSKPPQASETSQPTKLGKFGGGLYELEVHGNGVIELHALAIATPLLFFSFFLSFL